MEKVRFAEDKEGLLQACDRFNAIHETEAMAFWDVEVPVKTQSYPVGVGSSSTYVRGSSGSSGSRGGKRWWSGEGRRRQQQ